MKHRVIGALILALAIAGGAAAFGPSRYGFSDRVERHYFPEVTTGPAEPTWSPDGQWLAFSMQGDIWKVPAEGGEAIALTRGPRSYFEPTWSPDGRAIAFTADTAGHLAVGVVPAGGGEIRMLTESRGPELNPAWSADSQFVFYAAAVRGAFDIFRVSVADGSVTTVVSGGGSQIQPSVSPDGRTLAYVSPVSDRLGTGGIWTRSLDSQVGASSTAESRLVYVDEAEYRTRPRWMPDSRAFLFGSDDMGSNDIAMVSASGGNAVVLTNDPMGEFSAVPSPDGSRLAFISNRTGPMTLFTAPIGGGPEPSWRRIEMTGRRALSPTGRLRGRIVDSVGRPMPGRIQLVASDGRSYAPDDGFARVMAVTETHYFHTTGEFEVEVPAGPMDVTTLRGLEYAPVRQTVEVEAGGTRDAVFTLERAIDMPSLGWYSGDTHAHDYHQGRYGLSHEALYLQSVAEDLHVTNVLIHMDGTRLMGRWSDLTGEPHPLSSASHILQFSEEFRGSLGHIGMLGLQRFILPLIGGAGNTPYAQVASDTPYLQGARDQGGIAGFMHPYTGGDDDDPASWSGSLIPVDVALGRGDFYDVASLYSDEDASMRMYHRLLNAGFRLAATGGTDNFPDVWRDPPPGTDRTYAKVDGQLTLPSWLDAVKAGRTFATTGPLLLLDVERKGPGEEVRLPAGAGATVRVTARWQSLSPISALRIYVNGRPAGAVDYDQGRPEGPEPGTFAREHTFSAPIPDGGWIAAVATGGPSHYLGDSYAFAHTSPVYVSRDDKPPFRSPTDARFLAGVVDAIWARVERGSWRTEAERVAFKAEIDQARAEYIERAR